MATYRGIPIHIFGLARGGVATAKTVAVTLSLPVDVLVVRKISSPGNREFAIGAVTHDGVSLVHWKAAQQSGADETFVKRETERLNNEIDRMVRIYRKGKKPFFLEGKAVMLIDDGAATGATMETAVRWAKKKKAKKIIVAIPVISVEAGKLLRPEVDDLLTCHEVPSMTAVSGYYDSFEQLTDTEVIELVHSSYESYCRTRKSR